MSINFITFGGGNKKYIEAGQRLTNQASNLNLFNKITLYTDEDLKNDNIFWDKHSTFTNNRGYGYWLWKPYIIKKTIDQLKDGDILLYLDAGCEIDTRNKDKISFYLELVKTDYLIGTYTAYMEKQYNKMDLILYLDMLDDKYLNTYQHQAGLILIFICDKTRSLINEWYNIGCDYHNIDDSQSINKNLDCFKEHRHDQSIFSLLTKKYNLFSKYSLEECINIARNLSSVSNILMIDIKRILLLNNKYPKIKY